MTKRWVATLAGLAVVVQAARRYAKMQLAMAAVPVDLRSPALPLTSRSLRERSLRLGRLGMNVRTNPGRGVTMTECSVDSEPTVRVLVTTPSGAGERRPAVLHLHGGGMVVGSPQFEAFESGRDEGIELRAQVLVYPMMDDRTALRDDHGGRGKFMWTPASSRWAWTAYLGREPQMSDAPEYAAPARRTDLSGLPPAWVGVGDLDILYEEVVAYAERLKAHAVPLRAGDRCRYVSRCRWHQAQSACHAGVSARHGRTPSDLPMMSPCCA